MKQIYLMVVAFVASFVVFLSLAHAQSAVGGAPVSPYSPTAAQGQMTMDGKVTEGTDKTLVKVASGHELKGVTMPDEVTYDGKKLLFNGITLREVDILSIYIKVYVVGLYVSHRTQSSDDVLKSTDPVYAHMHFLRHVGASDMRSNWEKGVKENCADKCDAIKASLAKFKDALPAASSDDNMVFTFTTKGFSMSLNDKLIATIDDKNLANAILSVWIGAHPVTEQMKKDLLAGK